MAIDRQLHKLLVQPSVKNQSMLMGLAGHGERLVRGVPLDETHAARLGAAVARVGESVDHALGQVTQQNRVETLRLTARHLKDLDTHVARLDGGRVGPVRDQVNKTLLEHNALLRSGVGGDPYNNAETLDGLVRLAEQHPDLEVHLKDVAIPSALGETGKTVKDFLTDAATIYGATAIGDKLTRLASEPGEKQASSLEASMDFLEKAASCWERAAHLIETLPEREQAYDLAEKLANAGLISEDEVEKRASFFANDLAEAEATVDEMLKAASEKSASTFDVDSVGDEFTNFTPAGSGSSGSSSRFSRFDALCLEGLNT